MLRVWLQEAVKPQPAYAIRPGRWVAEPTWPTQEIESARWFINPQGLTTTAARAGDRFVRSNEESGSDAGSWIGWGRATDGPPDQRREDALALCFDSEPLEDAIEILGTPAVVLHSRPTSRRRPCAYVSARLTRMGRRCSCRGEYST